MDKNKGVTISLATALRKAEHYCAYQERSQEEVRRKLYTWRLPQEQVEWILSELIAGNFLNEMRFAQTFAEGKFRIKGWGKQKISHALHAKGVSEYCIRKALESIDETEPYQAMLIQQTEKWLHSHPKSENQQQKLIRYLLMKGYSYEEVKEAIQKIEYHRGS
jgi:regulatory protein